MVARSSLVSDVKGAKSLLSKQTYKKIYRYGVRFVGKAAFVTYLPENTDEPLLGLTVSRKYGNAVKRNRFKRLSREAFRATSLPPHAYNISPRGPCRPLKCQDLINDLSQLIHDLSQ